MVHDPNPNNRIHTLSTNQIDEKKGVGLPCHQRPMDQIQVSKVQFADFFRMVVVERKKKNESDEMKRHCMQGKNG